MYTNRTVNSTGWTVASESCAGSRRTWIRLRRVSTATSRHHSRIRLAEPVVAMVAWSRLMVGVVVVM